MGRGLLVGKEWLFLKVFTSPMIRHRVLFHWVIWTQTFGSIISRTISEDFWPHPNQMTSPITKTNLSARHVDSNWKQTWIYVASSGKNTPNSENLDAHHFATAPASLLQSYWAGWFETPATLNQFGCSIRHPI